jgi:hypothetical protein
VSRLYQPAQHQQQLTISKNRGTICSVEQVFIVRLPEGLARRLVGFLDDTRAGYESLNEFVASAVANQLNLLAPQSDTALSRTLKMGAGSPVRLPAVPPKDALSAPDERSESLFVLTNRLAPIKIATRVLANLYNDGVWPTLSQFHRDAADVARSIGLTLRSEDEAARRTGYDRRWIGFPIGDDAAAAQARFVTCFTVQADRKGAATGPLATLGLANLSGERVGLTQKGIDLAMLPSPLIGELDSKHAVTHQEAAVLKSCFDSAPAESAAISEFLEVVSESRGVQARIDRQLAKAHRDWTDLRVTSHRAAMTGRLRDLKLVEVFGKGPTSRIELVNANGIEGAAAGI